MVSVENEIFPLRKYNKLCVCVCAEELLLRVSCAFHCFIFPERNELLNWYVQRSQFFFRASSSFCVVVVVVVATAAEPTAVVVFLFSSPLCVSFPVFLLLHYCHSSRFSFLLAIIFCTRAECADQNDGRK